MATPEEVMSGNARRFPRGKCIREPFRELPSARSRSQQQIPRSATPAKTRACRFFGMPSGCVRGENCSFAHEAGDSRREKRISRAKVKKVLVSGLPSFVDSEDLFVHFEHRFGILLEAVAVPHSNEQVAGRFGILSFRNEESLFAAIQARDVYIFGQKVTMEVIYGRATKDPIDSEEFPCRKLFGAEEEQPVKSPPPVKSQCEDPSLPPWAQKFRSWLPEFLVQVAMRTGLGESYPLCSLKGDFRATCGMEIDHTELGFEKLSDFIRAWPEICSPKVVPVGTGPATHIVLDMVPQHKPPGKPLENPSQVAAAVAAQPLYGSKEFSQFGHRGDSKRGPMNAVAGAGSQAGVQPVRSEPDIMSSMCNACLREEALWMAFPCGHRTLCNACKEDAEDDVMRPCFICQGCIEGWAALP